MKKILFVEDNGSVFEMLKSELDSSYKTERVRAVDEAMDAEEEIGPFDCYVVDLQILAFGLTLSEMSEYQDREGYAFIKNFLFKDKTEEEIRKLKSKIIICSRYVLNFKKEFKDEIEGLILVDKTKGFEKKVVSLINKICKDE
jgi:CheY-like chemotaxis protein